MAVWIQIIGIRKSDSIENDKNLISKILKKAEFDFNFINNNSNVELEKINWNLTQSNGIEYFELPIIDQSLRIYFDNPNFIEFSGSFDLFSAWFRFTDEKQSELTNGIRKIFGKIASEYGISELLYFSEWFFSLDYIRDGNATFENLIEQIKNNPDCERNEIYGLESKEYYKEKINTVANTVYN